MVAVPTPDANPVPNYGIDADRVLHVDSLGAALRRRISGRYAVDEFGGDPHLMDMAARLGSPLRVRVVNPERLPTSGPALLVSNRGLGLVEPIVLGRAVRQAARRRLRVIGAPEVPIIGPATRKLGAIGYRPDDVAALLRAGHLAAAPLAPTWFNRKAGEPPRELLATTLGFPVVPMAVRPGGPAGLPIRPWIVVVGETLLPRAGSSPGDQLAAAELGEEVRRAVRALLEVPA